MSMRPIRRRSHGPMLLRAFNGLDAWWLANAGVETQRVVSVGRTKWTVCYKVHVIPSRRIEYKASITLWPNVRREKLTSRRQPGWHPDLVKTNWYQACGRELRRHGYHGSWQWSSWGRFGDFWKSLKDFRALAREAHALERLRKGPALPKALSNHALQRTGARGGRPGRRA
jgi:hypothetical protein